MKLTSLCRHRSGAPEAQMVPWTVYSFIYGFIQRTSVPPPF